MQHYKARFVEGLLNTIDNVFLVLVALWIFVWWLLQTEEDEQVNKE